MISTFRHGVCVCVTAMVLALFLVAAMPGASAGDFERGLKAYDAGDYDAAFAEWHPLAEQGVAFAQYNLGFMYRKGQGVPQDYAEAVKWFRHAAEQGIAQAQNNLGVLYYNGWGVPQNYVLAHIWYNLAASQGDEESLNSQKLMIENRDRIARLMTPAQIAEAQALAARCLASDYQDCGD